MLFLHMTLTDTALVPRSAVAMLRVAQFSAPKGATIMFAVSSAFNQVGLAFVVAVVSLGLLSLLS